MKVFVAGHKGMVGRHVANEISKSPDYDVLTADRVDLDLCDRDLTNKYISNNKPDQIIICAAKVGGILANFSNQYEFLLDNMKIQNNIFEAARVMT